VGGINGQGTITDNDTAPVVSLVSNQTTSEGNIMTFNVSISAASGRTVSVNYATSDNTATAGFDYTATSGTLTWAPLDSNDKIFTVAILTDDATPETGEYFTVTLSSPVGCTIGTGTATGTITDIPAGQFLDDFTRADTTASIGNGWTANRGNWGIVGNTAYCSTTTTTKGTVLRTYSNPNVSVSVKLVNSSGFGGAGLIIRATDYNNNISATINGANTMLRLYKLTAGTYTQIGSTYFGSIVQNDIITLSANSSNLIEFKLNGSVICSGTEAAGSGNTLIGMLSDQAATARYDNFTATDSAVTSSSISSISGQNVTEGNDLIFAVDVTPATLSTTTFSYSVSGSATASVDYTATPTFSNGVTESGGIVTIPIGVSSFTVTFTTLVNGDDLETINLFISNKIGIGTILAVVPASGDSLSTFAKTALVIENTATTDTLNVSDETVNGRATIFPPLTGTFTKTIHKTGSVNSKVFSKSRIGYARFTGNSSGPKIRIGNANLTLPQRHCFGLLVRVNGTSELGAIGSGYTGELNLCEVTQTDGTNKYMRITLPGGNFATTAKRKNPNVIRSSAGSSSTLYEYAGSSSAWGIAPNMYKDNCPPTSEWTWIWVTGRDLTDAQTGEGSLTYNESNSTFHGNNNISFIMALNGCHPSVANIMLRKVNEPSFSTGAVSYVNPASLGASFGNQDIDFTIGGTSDTTSKTFDVARVIKLNSFPGFGKIAAMCAGHHPDSILGSLTGDEFCIDLGATGSVPAGCTEINSPPTYNPAEDGPVVSVYHGLNSSDVVLNVVNKRIS
jgi:hypothetical protein